VQVFQLFFVAFSGDDMALNPRHARFVKLYASGGMSRSEAYEAVYGKKKNGSARQLAHQLITNNDEVKAKIKESVDEVLESGQERLLLELDETLDKYFFIRSGGNAEFNTQLRACMDHMDRIGLKAPEKIDLTQKGDLNIKLELPEDLDIDDII
jgi:hypothetical protein